MAAKVVPIQVGDVPLLIEVETVAGTEPTSRASRSAEGVVDVFTTLKEAIVELAVSTKELIDTTAQRAARPDQLQVEFGLKVSANGNVIVAGASAAASIAVTFTYNAQGADAD